MKSILFLAFASLAGAQITAFPPLDQWKTAVLSGDQGALAKFYRSDPPARVVAGNTEETLASELDFWAALKASGLTTLNPEILSIAEDAAGERRMVLRIQGAETSGGSTQKIVINAEEIWLKQPDGWRIVMSQRSGVNVDSGRALPEPAKPNPQLYPPPSVAPAELKTALATAARTHKRVLVVFGANWCYDCHVLDTTFRSKEFAPLVQSNYVVLHVNIGDEGKDNTALAARLGVNLEHGVPSLAVLNPDGSVIEAQKNGEFESTIRIGPTDIRAFLEKWKSSR